MLINVMFISLIILHIGLIFHGKHIRNLEEQVHDLGWKCACLEDKFDNRIDKLKKEINA